MFTYFKFIIMIDIDTFKHFFDNIRIFRFIMRYCQLTIEKRKNVKQRRIKTGRRKKLCSEVLFT